MEVNGKKLDIDSLTKDVYNDKSMIKMRGNGIYLSDNQIEVLKKMRFGIKHWDISYTSDYGIVYKELKRKPTPSGVE